MHKQELLLSILQKVAQSIERIIHNSENIDDYQYYYLTPAGMELLERTCMLLIAGGESIKGIDKLTDKQLFPRYPEIDWKGAMGIRDIIAHHYFDLDGEIVFYVVKENLPEMLECIKKIMDEMTRLPHESMA